MFVKHLRKLFVKFVKWFLAGIYILLIVYFTFIGRTNLPEPVFRGLFWEIQTGMWSDILLNILLFVPLGLIIGGWKGLIVSFVLSGAIETTQYFYQIGYCELDDILNNTIGAGIGVGIKALAESMVLKKWDDLPESFKNSEVRPYWEALDKCRGQLVLKRVFDILVSAIFIVILAIPMIVIAILIKTDSNGTVFYRQERVTKYGRRFRIHKFRTMVSNADKIGAAVTVGNDSRITRVGMKLRHLRLDEFPQLFDVLAGTMSFVGTRPEAVKYVEKYKPEYNATLLVPAGITSEASIRYKDEEKLLSINEDADKVYIEKILPEKMKWNLASMKFFSFFREIQTMFRTVFAVLGKNYN